MTSIAELYALQELDLELDSMSEQTQTAEQELSAAPSMEAREAAIQDEAERLQEFQSQRRTQQLHSGPWGPARSSMRTTS